ncbi:MAG TPA: hypothetical protein VFG89_01450 [Coriobacteriia bacterium]|nr:hypothetical protein [Coriobacteriia bacterium]
MHRVTSVIVICVLALMLVLGSGCAASQQPAASGGQTPTTTEGSTSSGASTATDGSSLAQEKCTQCHSFDRVQAAQKDKAGWESTLDRMVGHGLKVTDAERTAIIDYLVSK